MSNERQLIAARNDKPSTAYPDTRTIYYGVRVDNPSTTPAGDYKAGIVYTAIANLPPAPNEADITITPTTHRVDKDPDPNTNPSTLTITGSNLASIYKVQLQSTNPANITTTNTSNGTTTTNNNPIYTCTNPKVTTDSTNTATNPDSAIDTVTCIIPGRESNAESGVADITTIDTTYPYNVIITTQGGTVTKSSAFSYTKLLSINSVAYGEDESEDESQTTTMDITIDYDQHLIPVVYTGTDDKAEWSVVTNQELQDNPNNWFNYSSTEKRWANAVTVKPDTLTKYLNIMTGYVNQDTNPDQGTGTDTSSKVVAEEDILGYWVYIPRYAYEVQRPNAVDKVVSAQNFNIRFETAGDTKKTPATTCNNLNPTKEGMWKNGNTSGNNSQGASDPNNLAKDYREQCAAPGNTNGPDGTEITRDYPDNNAELANGHTTWATHPAFSWGTKETGYTELNGFWIGKFELTGKITEPTVLPNSFANVGNYIGEYWISIASMGVKDNNNTGEHHGIRLYLMERPLTKV